MKLSYTEIFKHSDILNPISATTLLQAGKLAQMGPKSVILDLGSGKAFPSLLWASIFGVQVDGFDINENYVEYANLRAGMLGLSDRARYSCRDIRELSLDRKYDAVVSLGIGIAETYGDNSSALRIFKSMLHKEGVLILAEPVWLTKPVSPEALEALGEAEQSFLTEVEMLQLMKKHGFEVLKTFVSNKEDWELYVGAVYAAMHEIIKDKIDLADEAREIIKGFKAEYDAVGKYWNMLLWVAKIR